MKEIPILFSPPMVQAILKDIKTETRRIAIPRTKNSLLDGDWTDGYILDPGNKEWLMKDNRFGQPGDLLWVRERFAYCSKGDGHFLYYAEDTDIGTCHVGKGWKPSIHMPKAAARIWLLNEGVSLERLHDITEAGAIAEGVTPLLMTGGHVLENAKSVYSQLWNRINGPASWEANPWVWLIKYKILSTTGRPAI